MIRLRKGQNSSGQGSTMAQSSGPFLHALHLGRQPALGLIQSFTVGG